MRHVFVRKDAEELNAKWNSEKRISFKITGNKNQAFIGSRYNIKENKQTAFSKWGNALSNYQTVGENDTIYANIPIVFKDSDGKTEKTIEPYFMYGDVNDDGEYNITDIAIIAAHIKGIKTLEGDALRAADVNRDGIVDENDISGIFGHVQGHEATISFGFTCIVCTYKEQCFTSSIH